MKGLLLKEFLILRKMMWYLVILMLIFVIVSIVMKRTDFISMIILMVCILLPATCLSSDERSGWDRYLLSGPIERKWVIKSKFISLLLCGLLGAIVVGIMNFLLFLLGIHFPLRALLRNASLIVGGVLIYGSVFLTLSIRWGTENGRMILIGSFVIPFVISAYFVATSVQIKTWFAALLVPATKLAPIAGVIVYLLCYYISYHIYRNKEF